MPRLILHIPETFLHDVRLGVHYGYPKCCVAQFAAENALSTVEGKNRRQALERGGIRLPNGEAYVPCVFHQGNHPYWYPFKSWQKLMMEDDQARRRL